MNAWQRFWRLILPARDKRDEEMDLVNGLICTIYYGLRTRYDAANHGGWRSAKEIEDNKRVGGTCRHAATWLMFAMLQKFAERNKDISADTEYVEGQHRRVPQGTSYHAWIEWRHAGRTWICDPFQDTRAWRRSQYGGEYDGVLYLTPDQVRDRIRAEDMAAGRRGQ